VLGGERGLLGLILFGHFLGVAAGSLRVLELLVLDREEFGAQALHLLLGGRPHIGRGDDGAKPARGRDRLQAGNTDAHDEHLRGGHGAGRRHHHRKGAAKGLGALDDGAIAGEVRLRRQHVHHLRAGDARHQFHRKRGDAGIRHRLQRGVIAVRIHDRDDQRAALVFRELGGFRPFHLDDDVGILHRIRADRGADRGEIGIRQAGLDACTGLDRDLDAERLEFLHRVGRGRDAWFGGIDLPGNRNLHEASGRRGARVLDGSCASASRHNFGNVQTRKIAIRIRMRATLAEPHFTSWMKPSYVASWA
jgi:hypothetical protein